MIRIHHLSDLHFGRFSKAAGHVDRALSTGIASPRSVYDQYLEYLRELGADDAPDFVVISGDLSSVGSHQELALAHAFVVRIRKALTRIWGDQPDARTRLIIVPGNHDYSYEAVDEAGRMNARREFHDLFQEYITPHGELEGGRLSGVSVHGLYTARTGPIGFYCVDSCGIAGHVDEHAVQEMQKLLQAPPRPGDTIPKAFKDIARKDPGFVDPRELQAGLARAPAIPDGALKICVAHHPVHSAASPDVDQYPTLINAGSLRAALTRQQVHVVLSGHVHSHDIVLEYPIANESFGWGIYSLTGGTFGGDGDTQDCFTSLEFESLPSPAALSETDGWLCHITKFQSMQGSIRSAGRLGTFFVERQQQTMNRHLAIHKARSPRAGDAKLHEAQKAHEKLARFFKNYDLPPTLHADRVEDLNDWVSAANRLYAVDVQAFDAWLDPLVFYYFCLQIPRYVSKSLDADNNRWTLRLTPLVYNAMQNALTFLDGRQSKTNFQLKPSKENHALLERRNPSKHEKSVEIARVLLWTKENLCSEDGKSFCKMHDALRIPLFYLNPMEDELENEKSYTELLKNADRPKLDEVGDAEWERQVPSLLFNEDNLKIEYIYGLNDETFSGGLYVDLAAEKPADQPFPSDKPAPIGRGRFHHRIHFEQLLRHKKLRFASDAIHAYLKTRPGG